MFFFPLRWNTDGLRCPDGNNVPLQLKKVLKAMQEDLPQPAPHEGFLHCLDRNHIRRKNRTFSQQKFHSDVV